ncbi:hypothetical protein GYMLUDRAFT_235946 [Collybiopsis luxurians FD-317 M1]|nr:hypothetical protein GYMLUDRAFT_235946 [Collybiopsis luxurians FD-317 M1]
MASVTSNSDPVAKVTQPPPVIDPATAELTKLLQEAVEKFEEDKGVKLPEWNAILQDMDGCNSVEKTCDVLEKHLPAKFPEMEIASGRICGKISWWDPLQLHLVPKSSL